MFHFVRCPMLQNSPLFESWFDFSSGVFETMQLKASTMSCRFDLSRQQRKYRDMHYNVLGLNLYLKIVKVQELSLRCSTT